MASSYGRRGGYGSPTHQHPQVGATFTPGGFDDYYMPAPAPELISPSPQRLMPEVPEQIQDGIAHLELEANETVPRSRQPAQRTMSGRQNGSRGGGASTAGEVPSLSPFPKLQNPPPNVPPSDEDKEAILWDARLPVLNSNDPEMQLAWAQDALAYVDAAMTHSQRLAESEPARPATPQVEHQLRVDAMSIVSFLADQSHPKAEFMRGMWLEFGKFGQRQDKREAYRSYQRAADKGYSRAEYRMGTQFEQSNDPIKALQHYKKGADEGDSASNYRLGMMTLLGQAGQQQDYVRGLHLLRQAAATADENAPQGAYVLGMLMAQELPQVQIPQQFLPYDEQGAKANIEKAAYLGFAKAQAKMGSAYELCTLGCEFNPALSLHYNALASRQGEIEADMAISKWFLCGAEGVFQKNDELAFAYAQRAATAGLPTAMFGLGYFYEIGLHVPKSVDQALEWYGKAAAAGNEEAKGRIAAISNSGSTLSKTDHENVAVSRIKSTHGSRRGKRPPGLAAKAAASNLPTTAEEQQADDGSNLAPRPATTLGTSSRPRRSSSMTPYPMSDAIPTVTPLERPATVAPYPVDNGPPRLGGGGGAARLSTAGGFVPELRPQSYADSYSSPGLASSPSPRHQHHHQQQQQPQHRPHSNLDPGGAAWRNGYGRTVSGPPPPSGYRQPSGAAAPSLDPRPELPPKTAAGGGGDNQAQAARPTLDIGFSAPAPDAPNSRRLQRPGGLQGRRTSGEYVAPLGVHKNRQQGVPPPSSSSSSGASPAGQFARPPRVNSGGGGSGGSGGMRPGSVPPARPQGGGRSPSAVASGGGGAGAGRKSPVPAAGGAAGARPRPPGGKGPKTFEEMGVPQQKNEQDCTVM